MNDRWWKIGLMGIALLALVLRLGYTWFADGGRFRTEGIFSGDGQHYEEMGRSLAAGRGFCLGGHLTSWRSPFYPVYLSTFMRVMPRPLVVARISQCVLGALTCLLAAMLGARLCDRRIGLLAAAACALSYELINLSAYIVTETLFTFLLLSGLLLFLKSTGRKGRWWMTAAAAVLLGLMTLTRASGLLLPVALGACLLLEAWRNKTPAATGRRVAVLLVVFATTLLPWIIRNNRVHDEFILLTAEPGKLLYSGYGPTATGGTGGWYRYGVDIHIPPELATGRESEASHRLANAAVDYAMSDPLRAIALAPRKFWNMWRPWVSGASIVSTLAASIFYVPVVLLALISPFVVGKVWRWSLFPLYGVVAYMAALHVAIIGAVRFRYPLLPLLVVMACACLVRVWERRLIRRPDRNHDLPGKQV